MELHIQDILRKAIESGASDLFLVAGRPASCRIHGKVVTLQDIPLMPDATRTLITEIYQSAGNRSMEHFNIRYSFFCYSVGRRTKWPDTRNPCRHCKLCLSAKGCSSSES